MGIFDVLCGSPAEDPSVMKVRNILQNITDGIRVKFSCQVLPPEIILGEKWKTGNQTEIGVIDFVRRDNNWTIDEFERLLNANKVYVCSVHVRIDMESPDDNIVSPTYGHWGDWDLEAWMEENLHIPVLAVGIKRDSCNNPYRCFRFVMMEAN